jgi:YidC/Oxa1 family membrane protein insertase
MNKDFLRNLIIAGAVFFLVLSVTNYFVPPPKPPAKPQDEVPVPILSGPTADGSPSPAPEGTPPATGYFVDEAPEVATLVIGATFDGTDPKAKSEVDPYRMRLRLSNIGASIESAEVTDHKASLLKPDRYRLLAPIGLDDATAYRSLAIEKINVGVADANGQISSRTDIPVRTRRWHVLSQEETEQGVEVTFGLDVLKDGQPFLQLVRRYSLPRQPKADGRRDLIVDLTIRNLTDRSVDVVAAYLGGLGLTKEDTRTDDRVIDYGLKAGDAVTGARLHASAVPQVDSSIKPIYSEATAEAGQRLVWAATANKYFTCTIAPLNESRDALATDLAAVDAVAVDPSSADAADVTARFVSRPLSLAAGGVRTLPLAVYLGEKNGRAFKKVEDYSSRNYYHQVGADVGWCTFAPLVELMVALLNAVYRVFPNYGVAIFVLVLIVRFILHPVTKAGQVNMVRMQKQMEGLGPKMAELKKRFGNDQQKYMMEVRKLQMTEGMNPAGQLLTCLPMLLQMPIWVALFISLSHNIAMRHQPFVFWIKDLTAPDALFVFSTPFSIPLMGVIHSFNLLPFLVAATNLIQQKTMPKPKPNPSMSEEQKQQQAMMQKMMPIMAVLMLFIFYSMPSGLTLYVMSSSILGTIEQWRIRVHVREREAAGTLHKPKKPGGPDRPKGTGMMARLMARMEAAAEEAKKAQQQPGGKVRK